MKVSVIIPALGESNELEKNLRELKKQKPHEIIVVASGGTRTGRIKKLAKIVERAEPLHRAAAMNLGAKKARGNVLLFLHADTRLPKNGIELVKQKIREGALAGCFKLRFDSKKWQFRLIEFWANLVRLPRKIIYGDHALFVRKDVFKKINGFPNVSLFEDTLISYELRKLGRIGVIKNNVLTSPRRFEKRGIWKQVIINWVLKVLFFLGTSTAKLKKLYDAWSIPKTTSPYVEIRKSRIHNKGVFAKKRIPKNTVVMEYVGEKITKKESDRRADAMLEKAKRDPNNGSVYVFELDKKYDIDGNVPWNTARFINHSCDPNCEADVIKGKILIKAVRDIKKGEEITYNYNYDVDEHTLQHPCRCGTKRCVGFIAAEEQWGKLKRLLAKKKPNLILI